jgi:hypothetical protein
VVVLVQQYRSMLLAVVSVHVNTALAGDTAPKLQL